MPRRTFKVGPYVLVLSMLWIAWILRFLPTQSIPGALTCTQLSFSAHSSNQVFVAECVRLLKERPEDTEEMLLLITCAALALVSTGMLLRERSLAARIRQG